MKTIIEERIAKLKAEEAELRISHERLVADHKQRTNQVQQIIYGNQSRFQQITGGIAQLTELLKQLNGSEQPTEQPSK